MRIRVISLPDAVERRRQAETQLSELGLEYDFFDALCPERVEPERMFESRDERLWVLNTGRRITDGELACFASHRALWQRCADSAAALLIMEDDFRLLPGFRRAVRLVAELIDGYGFIRLQTETRARSRQVLEVRGFDLRQYTKAPHSMMCYALSPKAARSLVAHSQCAAAPVDVFVKQFWRHGQDLYGLSPYTVTESPLSRDTQLKGRRKCRKSLATRLARTRHRLAQWSQRMRY